MTAQIPKSAGIAIIAVVCGLFFGLIWWSTGYRVTQEEPESAEPPRDVIAQEAWEKRDREGRPLAHQMPPNRYSGGINHEEK